MAPDTHGCTQGDRLTRVEKRVDALDKHFQVDGVVGSMAKNVERLLALSENRPGNDNTPKNQNGPKNGNGIVPSRLAFWVILVLAVIIAGLLGIDIPFAGAP